MFATLLEIDITPGAPMAPRGSLAAKLLKAGFKLNLKLEEEDHAPDYDDEAANAQVRRAMERGDPWAWFNAHLVITHPDVPGMEGVDNLGGCGGYSKTSWFDAKGYWPDMVSEAFTDYKTAAQRAAKALEVIASVKP